MPIFLTALLGGLINIAGTLAGRVLISLGFGFVTYTGVKVSLDYAASMIWSNLSALPPGYQSLLGALQVDTGISIVISAVLMRLTLNGLTSGTLKKLVAH